MDTLAVLRHELAPALASALLHCLWQGALLAVAAAWTFRAMARASAAWRHTVGMFFLAAMISAPAVQFVRFTQDAPADASSGWLGALAPAAVGEVIAEALRTSPFLAPLLASTWLLGAGLMLAWHVRGLSAVAAMERDASNGLSPAQLRRLDELREAMGVVRAVTVKVTSRVLTPCTARLFKPVIWMPVSLLTRAPARQVEALLAHELAHIARRDWLWNGVQCVVEALLFFHPAVWWLGGRIRQEREHACDDLAVAACGDAVALAEALADLERRRAGAANLLVAAAGGSLLQRVRRLLVDQPSRRRWAALAVVGALGAGSVLLLTEIGMAGGRLPDLRVTASTAGELGPGDFREIAAEDQGRRRYYREQLDALGRRTEIYRENGQDRPIDAQVRRWIGEITDASLAAPTPRSQTSNAVGLAEYDTLIEQVVTHPDVVARLGAPVVAASGPLDGSLRLHETGGEADLTIRLHGARAAASARVVAELDEGAWTIRDLRLP